VSIKSVLSRYSKLPSSIPCNASICFSTHICAARKSSEFVNVGNKHPPHLYPNNDSRTQKPYFPFQHSVQEKNDSHLMLFCIVPYS
jgi:hypothetical protein